MTRRLFGTLCGLVFLVSFGRTVFAPLLTTLQSAFAVGPATVGIVASLVWFGTALPRIPVGYLLTRVPRHRVVVGTGLLLALAAAVTAAAPSIRVLQVGAFAVGVASGVYFATAVPLVGELYPDGVGRAVGIHGTAAQLAAVVAPSVAVVVLAVASWRAVFWLLTAGALVVTAIFASTVRGADVAVGDDTDARFRTALAHWRVVGTGILMISTAGFVWQGLFNFYPAYLVTAKGLSQTAANGLLTLVFAAGVPAFWVSGRLADRLPHVPYVLGLLVVYVAGVVALTLAQGYLSLALVTVAVGYAIHSLFPALDTYVLRALPADNRGSVYAVFSGLSLLVEANGSGVVGVLTEAGYAFDTVFRGFAGALCVVVALLATLYRLGRLPGPSADPTRR